MGLKNSVLFIIVGLGGLAAAWGLSFFGVSPMLALGSGSAVGLVLALVATSCSKRYGSDFLASFPLYSPEPIIRVHRSSGKIHFANKAAEAVLNAWECKNSLHIPDRILSGWEAGWQQESLITMDVEQGEQFFELVIKPRTSTGYFDIYGKDITQRKAVERELSRTTVSIDYIHQIINALPDILLVVDSQGVVQEHNGIAHGVFKRNVAGVGIDRLFEMGSQLFDDEGSILDQLGQQEPQQIDVRATTRGKPPYSLTLSTPFIPSGSQQTLQVVVASDSSQAIELNDQLRRAVKEADSANMAKGQFLANMSHEIRTPMNAVIGTCSLLTKMDLDDKAKLFVERIRLAGDSLLGLINDILDFSKIEANEMTIETASLDLGDLVDEITRLYQERFTDKGLALDVFFDYENIPPVLGDATRIRQVLTNLLGNSIKFTHEGGIEIFVSRMQGSDQQQDSSQIWVSVTVRDSGIGIPAAVQERLFTPFAQADASTTRKYGGTGLGLSICRRLVDLMGGELTLTSQEGMGSSFEFSLPLTIDPQHLGTSVLQQKLMNSKVLLVGKEDYFTAALQTFAQYAGWRAQTCFSLNEAHTLITGDREPPRFVLLDADMLSRSSLTDQGRRLFPEGTKAIVFHNLAMRSSDVEALNGRFESVLEKPLRRRELFEEAGRLLGFTEVKSFDQDTIELPRCQVLVVEDNLANQELMASFMEVLGQDITLAANGQLALDALSRQSFDLIFMDCQMPVLDGYEATQKIKSEPAWQKIPVIGLTANAMKTDRIKCMQAGMDDFISKPVKLSTIKAMMAKWIPLEMTRTPAPLNQPAAATHQSQPISEQPPQPQPAQEEAAEPSEPAEPEQELINWSSLESLAILPAKDGVPFHIRSIHSFLEASLQEMRQLKQVLVAHSDPEELKAVAHRFKTNCGIVGAGPLTQCCQTLEQDAENADWASARAHYNQSVRTYRQTKQALENYLKRHEQKKAA